MISCHTLSSHLEAYVDGELPLSFLLDADCHLALCRDCAARVRFERTFHACIKNATRGDAPPPQALERRIRKAVFEKRAHNIPLWRGFSTTAHPIAPTVPPTSRPGASMVNLRPKPWHEHWRPSSWRVALPAAAVAIVAICWGSKRELVTLPPQSVASDLSLSQLDNILDLMTERHSERRPESEQYQSIRVSVETALVPPFSLPPMQVASSLHSHSTARAAAFSAWHSPLVGQSAPYTINGHHATFFMYHTQTAPLRARLEGRILDGQVVYVGKRQGYSIATIESGPIGYAMTSDLSLTQNAQIIISAVSSSSRHGVTGSIDKATPVAPLGHRAPNIESGSLRDQPHTGPVR